MARLSDELVHRASADTLSRRAFLARMAIGAGAGALACLGDPPAPVLPEQSGLEHVVVVMMENRSFDHFLGWLPGADGKQAGLLYRDLAGIAHETHRLTPDLQGCGFADPDHEFGGGRVEYNAGACDGWLRAGANDVYAIGYYTAEDLPFFAPAALEWTVLDRYFAPIMGPTGPNRFIMHAGLTDRIGPEPGSFPNYPTIWDRLADKGLTGRNYVGPYYFAKNFGDRYPWLAQPIETFAGDAAAGNLPHVAFVEPDAFNNDHPHGDIRDGEAFLASVYRAVTTSPAWRSTLFIITFYEWGGFFDHVPPPPAPIPAVERAAGNLDGLRGFRVPCLLISPFARRHYISSTVYDHASILRLIEWRWGLAPLSVRDANANNMADELDFRSLRTSAPVLDVPAGRFGINCDFPGGPAS